MPAAAAAAGSWLALDGSRSSSVPSSAADAEPLLGGSGGGEGFPNPDDTCRPSSRGLDAGAASAQACPRNPGANPAQPASSTPSPFASSALQEAAGGAAAQGQGADSGELKDTRRGSSRRVNFSDDA